MVFFKNLENKCCKKRDRKATEQAILLAASKLFAEKGFEATRTLEIAKEAGANEALITRYFGGKIGLLTAVIKNEEALKIIMDKSNSCVSRFEEFPYYSTTGNLKIGIEKFFENGIKTIDFKDEFIRIGASRCLVDPEMGAAIRENILTQHMPLISKSLGTYPEFKSASEEDLKPLAFLLCMTGFQMNFYARKIHQFDIDMIQKSMTILAESIAARYAVTNPS